MEIMTIRRIVTIFDRVDTHSRKWVCQHPNCNHQTKFITVALLHQRDAHAILLRDLVQRTAHITHKTEVVTDAG